MRSYLFAYGTLQPGLAPPEVAPLVARLEPVGPASVPGLLYDLGEYPGAILDPASTRKIQGTVFKLPADPTVLAQLDAYEGCIPETPEESLFVRIQHPAELAGGGFLPCWVYVFNRNPAGAPILERGTYQPK